VQRLLEQSRADARAIRDGWFHTGDLASRDEEGYCYIVDRKKDMFISGVKMCIRHRLNIC